MAFRHCVGAISVVCCLVVFAGWSAEPGPAKVDPVEATRFWKPYLCYLLATPHPRLYVEIDAVKGCEPSEPTLDKLRSFLAASCNKPKGIEIVRSDVISRESARGVSPKDLAHKFLNGPPPTNDDSSPAFMYVLFYDGALCDEVPANKAGQADSHASSRPLEKNNRPHVDFLPYPAGAFINTSYGSQLASNEILLHEAGHLLGLVSRSTYASNYHCLDPNCFMNETVTVHIGRLLMGRNSIKQRQLCDRCLAELAENSKQPPPANVRFIGPVLVRSEDGYHVLGLPSRVRLIVGNLTDKDCRDFLADVRAETPRPEFGNALHAEIMVKDEIAREPDKLIKIIDRARADPYKVVRTVAARFSIPK